MTTTTKPFNLDWMRGFAAAQDAHWPIAKALRECIAEIERLNQALFDQVVREPS